MLSRRLIRAKVLQELYAFITSDNDDLMKGERALERSFNKLYELFIYQISILVAIHDFAQKRIEERKKKFIPTEEDLHPNMKFAENKVIALIKENRGFLKEVEKYRISWADEDELIRKLYVVISESKSYYEYMQDADNGFEEDRNIWLKIIKNQLSNSDLLKFFYEEKNIYWVDDYYIANYLVIKMLKEIDREDNAFIHIPPLFKSGPGGKKPEDWVFAQQLFRKTLLNADKMQQEISDKIRNWEMDRVAVLDVLILKMALTELTDFPSIPVKVTMNEYIDLAKMFSTPKSSMFVNGVLDRIISDFRDRKLINKSGRGLL